MRPIPTHRRILGENIRSVREAEGLSERELGELAKLPPGYIRKVEAGRVNVAFDTVAKLAEALKISVSDLTSGF